MIHARRAALAASVVYLLSGVCVLTQAQGRHLDKKAFEAGSTTIKSIDVMEVVQQQTLMVIPSGAATPAAPARPASGGRAMNAVPEQTRLLEISEKLSDAFKRKNSSLGSEFNRQLLAAIKAKGIDARLLRGNKLKQDAIFSRMELGPVNTSADAVLHTVLRFAGYKEDAAGVLPMVGVDVYLFEAKSGRLLYRQVFNQGHTLVKGAQVESIPVADQAKFNSRAALANQADAAADGLVQLLVPVAGRIAEQISR